MLNENFAIIDNELTKQDFHKQYYDSDIWSGKTTFLGLPILKCPMDLWMYQQLIYKVKPKVLTGFFVVCKCLELKKKWLLLSILNR